MKLWRWFCRLGVAKKTQTGFGTVRYREKLTIRENPGISGVEGVCTRLNGEGGCQCGSTLRGRYCIWSYYRINS